jgi:riboflavin kinase/FMN adenylyltransferase
MEVLRAASLETERRAVSSSCIRRLLLEGRVEEAAQWLTCCYRLKGHVVEGRRIGRTLGFPTANIAPDDPGKVRPGMGVYAVRVYLGEERYKGMLSVGNRPTIGGDEVVIEVHLLHFSGDLYRQPVEVEFVRRLRENRKFDSPEALRMQLAEDGRSVEAMSC